MRRLTRAGKPVQLNPEPTGRIYRRSAHDKGIEVAQKGRKIQIEFDAGMSRAQLEGAFSAYLKAEFDT